MDNEPFFDFFTRTQIYDLEQPRSSEAPLLPLLVPGFTYTLHRRHEEGTGDPRTAASGFLATTDHAGTHIDALSHVAENLCLHGGEKVTYRIQTPTGFTRMGAETIAPIFCRGVLLDVAGYRGVEWISADQPVTRQEVEAVCLHQQVTLHEGDVALIRTENGARWHNPSDYLSSGGVRADASQWFADQQVRAVGADHLSWDTDGRIDPEWGMSLPGHVILLVRHGIYIMENLFLEDLARDQVYEFLFVCLPLKIQGATGSPIRPVAIVPRV
ncbi:cyclase family protein [Ktedonobacter robiniae]|uniref:Cyclase n=1 Tax=Ktedonobacter robiniae TaxID=2778365 RepID=A0ABQ3USI1_9CHLR|nr:cyclase family protein [Ktedonobacter robiniae]GHO55746.1 cyclase [Ktedonobacter robiniae]